MKKIISISIVVIMTLVCCVTAFADVELCAVGSVKRSCTLSISGGTATCTSLYSDSSSETANVVITQSLEKHSFLWSWDTVGGDWIKSTNSGKISLTNQVSGLLSGTYRVKTVFDVTSSDGAMQTITLYSSEKSC